MTYILSIGELKKILKKFWQSDYGLSNHYSYYHAMHNIHANLQYINYVNDRPIGRVKYAMN